ncbi:EAL domain-containing protein [Ketobacter sp.]|uniref:EAL domain-containing protein n=1 Tax=Ketobacter sp. TaxID=2083498 RepID=UPI000F24CED0|nr:EAL domain-containing protein [Ketobacter sp.]RLT94003.1 MAG: EAL domain-containing protein [Ketobacter sp.]
MSKSILYVEDDLVQATLVKPMLADEGYSVYHVNNGFSALEALQSSKFDAVLTDHYMPNLSGIELLQEIGTRGIQIPVVIMTAANDISLAFSALRLGAADFISKDADGNYLNIIAPVLTRATEKHQLQVRARQLTQQLEVEKHISYTTMDALTQGVVVLDEHQRVKYCNLYFRKLFQIERENKLAGSELKWLISLCIAHGELNGVQDPKAAYALVQALLADQREPLQLRLPNAVLEIRCSLLGDSGHVLTLADISHQVEQLNALDRVINLAPVAMLAVEKSGKIVLANRKACELLEITAEQVNEISINRFVPFESRHGHQALISNYFDNMTPRRMREGMDLELLNNKGAVIPVEVSLSGIEMHGKQRVLATVVDISHRKQAERVMKQAHQLTQSIIEQSPFSIVATDIQGKIIAVSPALEAMLWYERDELVNQQNAKVFHEQGELDTRAALLSAELGAEIEAGFQALVEKARRGVVEGCEWTYVRKDGSTLPVNLTVNTLRSEDGVVTGYLLVAYDITDQKRANEYIEHIAHHDGLTGLPNRTLMQDRLQTALLRVKRQQGGLAVLVLDLDRFKRINDTLGHLAGDQLLKTVAERLLHSVRESDTVCRMGGDEFVVLLPDIDSIKDVERVCRKILELVAKPITVGLNNLVVTPSIGFSLYPEHGDNPETLLKHADMAMYHAKQSGRSAYKVFDHSLASNNLENLAIEQALHEAFRHERLELHYQPQLDVSNGLVVGVEALLRWPDAKRGMIPPAQFIPMAETTGFITTLGEWVLRQACADVQQLRVKQGVNYRVAVNVSPRQFEHANFVSIVKAALQESGLPPQALELEITESMLMVDSDAITSKLSALSKMGVVLAIDDFGTGYSSLSYVSQYPIDVIKIDRSFMAIEKKQNVAIVSAITAIAEGLELEVVAEGVESVEQLQFVQRKGCHVVQGFYYSPAVPLKDLVATIGVVQSKGQEQAALRKI